MCESAVSDPEKGIVNVELIFRKTFVIFALQKIRGV